jgi:vacuolar-type H+-ATPase subunit E/Vma4
MKTHGSIAAVAAAIQDDVQIEIERLEAETTAELVRLRRDFESRPPVVADRDARLAFARAQARERLAREDDRDARAEIEVRDAWMQKVVAAARRRMTQTAGPCRRRVLGRLADEALAKIPARECMLQIRHEDVPLADAAWVSERIGNAGKANVKVVGSDIDGGCIAVSADGRVAYDNSIAARSERFEAHWRTALATFFEEARR